MFRFFRYAGGVGGGRGRSGKMLWIMMKEWLGESSMDGWKLFVVILGCIY